MVSAFKMAYAAAWQARKDGVRDMQQSTLDLTRSKKISLEDLNRMIVDIREENQALKRMWAKYETELLKGDTTIYQNTLKEHQDFQRVSKPTFMITTKFPK